MLSLYFVEGNDDKLFEVYQDLTRENINLAILYRGDGYKHNLDVITTIDNTSKEALDNNEEVIVLTNDETLLNYLGLWDEEEKIYTIWKYVNTGWARLDTLTDKELREAHNLTKMYYNGVFDEEEDVDEDSKESNEEK